MSGGKKGLLERTYPIGRGSDPAKDQVAAQLWNEGLSVREIAERLGVAQGSVRKRLKRIAIREGAAVQRGEVGVKV